MKWQVQLFVIVFGAMGILSCGDRGFYSEMRAMDQGSWAQSDTLTFTFEVTDTLHYHHIKGLFRINSDYAYRNLYTKAILKGPGDISIEEVNNHDITNLKGEFLGSGMGKLKDYKLVLFDKLALKKTGTYTVQLMQYFRVNTLQGVQDVGLQVHTTNKIY